MKKIITLKKNYEFKNVLSKGKFYIGKQIIIYLMKNREEKNVIGIAISTKSANAVKRNHIKRLIRANYQNIESRLKKGYNIVFLWNKKANIEDADFHTIEKDMEYLLAKADIIEKSKI